jgi:hypothetical protein
MCCGPVFSFFGEFKDPPEAFEEPEEKETEEKSNCNRIRGATGCTFCFQFNTN